MSLPITCITQTLALLQWWGPNQSSQKSSLSVRKHHCSLYKSEQDTVINFVSACSIIPVIWSGIIASFKCYLKKKKKRETGKRITFRTRTSQNKSKAEVQRMFNHILQFTHKYHFWPNPNIHNLIISYICPAEKRVSLYEQMEFSEE